VGILGDIGDAGVLPRLRNVTVRGKEWKGGVIFLHEIATGSADRLKAARRTGKD
jgi:DNA mismatch repair ATPase MutS